MGRAAVIMIFGFATSFGTIKYNLSKQAVAVVATYSSGYQRVIRRNVKNSAANVALREVLENLNWRADGLSDNPQEAYDQVFPWRGDTTITAGLLPGVRIEVSQADSGSSITTALRIRAISEYDDIADTTVVLVDRTSFSKYAYFTDYEGNIWFGSGDTIRGPLHTNDQFHINGDATFHGLMSSVADTYVTSGNPNPHFLGGTNFSRRPIPMPGEEALEYLKEDAQTQGHLYDGELWLTFNADGTYDYVCTRLDSTTTTYSHSHLDSSAGGESHTHPMTGGWETHSSTHSGNSNTQRYSDMQTNVSIGSYVKHRHFGSSIASHSHVSVASIDTVTESGTRALDYETVIATSNGDIHVQGTVDGKVTVYSGDHIWIDDDIRYADDARDGASNDLLGLLAYKSVTVTDNAANNDGHVWIDATLGSMTTELPPGTDGNYASYEKCFHVENFATRSPRGTLHVLGGIVQRERGAVGLGSTYGFDKDYRYDERFLQQRPPKYPVLRENLIISWWE